MGILSSFINFVRFASQVDRLKHEILVNVTVGAAVEYNMILHVISIFRLNWLKWLQIRNGVMNRMRTTYRNMIKMVEGREVVKKESALQKNQDSASGMNHENR